MSPHLDESLKLNYMSHHLVEGGSYEPQMHISWVKRTQRIQFNVKMTCDHPKISAEELVKMTNCNAVPTYNSHFHIIHLRRENKQNTHCRCEKMTRHLLARPGNH